MNVDPAFSKAAEEFTVVNHEEDNQLRYDHALQILQELGARERFCHTKIDTTRVQAGQRVQAPLFSYLEVYGPQVKELSLYSSNAPLLEETLDLCPNIEKLEVYAYRIDKIVLDKIEEIAVRVRQRPKDNFFSLGFRDCIITPEVEEALKTSSLFPWGIPDPNNWIERPKSLIAPEEIKSDERVIEDVAIIREKLIKELEKAAESWKQNNLPLHPTFKYISSDTDRDSYLLIGPTQGSFLSYFCSDLIGGKAMHSLGLQEAFSISLEEKNYPAQLFAIFDPIRGNLPALYAKEHLKRLLLARLQSGKTKDIWNALKLTFVDLHKEIRSRYKFGGLEALVCLCFKKRLWTASTGRLDAFLSTTTGSVLPLCDKQSLQKTEYARSVEKKGNTIFSNRKNSSDLRIKLLESSSRVLGCNELGEVPHRPKITTVAGEHVKRSILVMGSKSLSNKVKPSQINELVFANRHLPLGHLTRDLVHSVLSTTYGSPAALLVSLREETLDEDTVVI